MEDQKAYLSRGIFGESTMRIPVLFAAIVAAILPVSAFCQMVDPAIDREGEPFCYFSQPTDVIGMMDGKEGTLVTPEGYLYTGFGEIMFFAGSPPEPVHQRVKTLYKGYLPVIEYEFTRGGIVYHVRMFATTFDGNPDNPLMNFVRVTMVNHSKNARLAYFGIGTRYQNEGNTPSGVGDNRFRRPVTAAVLGQYDQAGVEFSKEWEYAFDTNVFLRDGKVMYMFPDKFPHVKMMTLKSSYNGPPDVQPGKRNILPTTPVGIVLYRIALRSDETQQLEFRIPYEPIQKESPLVTTLLNSTFDDYLGHVITFWEGIFDRGIDINLPEEKTMNTFKTSLVYDLIARNKHDGEYIQKVNEFQYDAFWLRDASYIVRSYDLSGYHDIARQCLDFFLRWQQPDGNFVSQGGQFDGWGQSLWAFGQHYRLTRDREFAEKVYPAIVKAVDWLRGARQLDSLHLMPLTTPGDNEDITGHVTGHNFWALIGLKNAIPIARDLGKSEDVTTFQAEYDSLHNSLAKRLKESTEKTGGYIQPGLDTLGGQDWDNMMAVYPEILLDPKDPLVTATLKATQAKYQEGLMTYGDGRWMHHYLTMTNTETEIVRGEQEQALRELYALLVHTSATHAGFEFCIRPWGERDFGLNLAPHGWFAAKFRAMLRNMLVREQDNQLHLLSVVSPEWIRSGSSVSVHRAPTNFGQVNFDLRCRGDRASLELKTEFVEKPKTIVLHLPWYMNVRSVKADGKVMKVKGGAVNLPAGTRKVDLQWSKKKTPVLSYANAVREYRKEYRRRYEAFLKNGNLPD
jgi:hypothetical protein